MRSIIEGWSVVVAGAWNTRIFTPEWLMKQEYTKSDNILVELPLGNPSLPPRLSFDSVKMAVTHNKLSVSPDDQVESTLEKATNIAIRSCELLSHTPVSAAGLNFQYVEDDIPEALSSLFNLGDVARVVEQGFEIGDTTIQRRLLSGDILLTLSFTHSIADSNVHIQANFNKNVEDAAGACAFFEKSITDYNNELLSVLNNIYDLEAE